MTVALKSTSFVKQELSRPRMVAPGSSSKVTYLDRSQRKEKSTVESGRRGSPPDTGNLLRSKVGDNPWVTPVWLRSLLGIQSVCSLVTFVLLSAVLVTYSSTVYSQQQWSQEYRKLEELRRDERQMAAANEVLKNQIAEVAEGPETGLVAPNQENLKNIILLKPAPKRSSPVITTVKPPEPSRSNRPLGY